MKLNVERLSVQKISAYLKEGNAMFLVLYLFGVILAYFFTARADGFVLFQIAEYSTGTRKGIVIDYVKKNVCKSDTAKSVNNFGLCSYQSLYNGLRD